MCPIPASELILHPDGSVFHLRLRPGELADRVILVGDPDRSTLISKYFDRIECRVEGREFRSFTGELGGVRLTVVSTGIGAGNIDIVLTELDALANVDFVSRTVRPLARRRSLQLVRLGTSGAVQPELEIGDRVMSAVSGGLDGVVNFYRDLGSSVVSDGSASLLGSSASSLFDRELEAAFVEHLAWPAWLARPYFVHNDPGLIALFRDVAHVGLTLSAPGFYGPQGRQVRLPLVRPDYLERIERFAFEGFSDSGTRALLRVTNIEMESAPMAGLAALLGHRALTVCTIIAQRVAGTSSPDYALHVKALIESALERLIRK